MAPRLKAAVNRDDCEEFLWPLCPRHKQNLPRHLKICPSKISVNSKLNPICAGYCALCLSCLLKICCPFSAQLAICGAQHLLTLTDFKCLANIPVWLWRKQKLCFYSTPSSEGDESIRGNSVCKHRKSSNFNFLSNIYRHTCYCLSSLNSINSVNSVNSISSV